jgi:hypothetical protein
MNIFKRLFTSITRCFTGPTIIDGFDVLRMHETNYNYSLFVNERGELRFTDREFINKKIIGVCEWDAEVKEHLNMDKNTVVLDLLMLVKT